MRGNFRGVLLRHISPDTFVHYILAYRHITDYDAYFDLLSEREFLGKQGQGPYPQWERKHDERQQGYEEIIQKQQDLLQMIRQPDFKQRYEKIFQNADFLQMLQQQDFQQMIRHPGFQQMAAQMIPQFFQDQELPQIIQQIIPQLSQPGVFQQIMQLFRQTMQLMPQSFSHSANTEENLVDRDPLAVEVEGKKEADEIPSKTEDDFNLNHIVEVTLEKMEKDKSPQPNPHILDAFRNLNINAGPASPQRSEGEINQQSEAEHPPSTSPSY